MDFTSIRTEIADRLGITSTASLTRLGRLINIVYREIGTSIGLQWSRHTAASVTTVVGTAEQTFTGVEKIERVWYEDSNANPHILKEVTLGELRNEASASSNKPAFYAVIQVTSNTVKVRLDKKPSSAYTLNADGTVEVADLSGTNEPAFSESFHDIIIEGVLKGEYRKIRDFQAARESERTFKERMSDLRYFYGKSNYLDIQQGKLSDTNVVGTSSGGSSASLGVAALTITGLWTFSRGAAAPFAVASGATYVANLIAEFLRVSTNNVVIGRTTSGAGNHQELTLDDTLEFSGTAIQRAALTGDVTATAGSNTTAIAAGVIVTADIADDQVTYAKMQNITTDSLIGRDTAATGDPETIGLNATLSMDGAGNLQRAALTGDVTASAGSNATTIANDVVTYAKIQNVSAASRVLGRGSAAGAGDTEELTIGSGLSISGTTLSASSATMSLLYANSGTDTNVAAATVDTIAISGLTAKDTVYVVVTTRSATQATATPILQNSTDSVSLGGLADAPMVVDRSYLMSFHIRQMQHAATVVFSSRDGNDSANASSWPLGTLATFVTAWTGSWTLALRHGGVTAGGTFQWSWAVHKIAGQ